MYIFFEKRLDILKCTYYIVFKLIYHNQINLDVMRKIYLSFLVAMGLTSLHAQDEFYMQSGSSVTVQNGGLLFVKGEVKGTGTASFNSDGKVIINTSNPSTSLVGRLNWNTGSNVFTSDTLIFNGDSPTSTGDGEISGSGPVSLGTLKVELYDDVAGENIAKLDILRDVTVTNKLRLDDGKIIVDDAYVLDVANSSAANAVESDAGFGANESNYVIGKLRRSVVNTGGDYVFPIGSENKGYNRFDLLLNSAPTGTNSVTLQFEEFSGTPNYNNPTLITVTGCSDNDLIPFQGAEPQYVQVDGMVSNFGIWKVRASNQNSTDWNYGLNAYPNLENATIRTSFAQFENIRLIKGDDNTTVSSDWSSWINSSGNLCAFANFDGTNLRGSIYNSYPIVDYIPARGLTGFSNFGAGGGQGSSLPVELVSLKADPIDNKFIRVSWTTATEINNAGFEVLRSEDGINFTNISWVDGAGNSSTMLNYKLDDNDVVANTVYYYRLRQVDYDGQSDLTNIVSAMITDNAVFVISEFMPNPTENSSSFTVVTSETRDINLTVYTTLGQIITDSRFVAQPNQTNKYEVNLSEMASGTYYAIITTGAHTFNKKIVVSR
jgi:hypothetical protein